MKMSVFLCSFSLDKIYRLQFHVQEERHRVRETRKVKGKEVIQEREVTDYMVAVEKIGHRDGFYEE
jgi:hypothetical protein